MMRSRTPSNGASGWGIRVGEHVFHWFRSPPGTASPVSRPSIGTLSDSGVSASALSAPVDRIRQADEIRVSVQVDHVVEIARFGIAASAGASRRILSDRVRHDAINRNDRCTDDRTGRNAGRSTRMLVRFRRDRASPWAYCQLLFRPTFAIRPRMMGDPACSSDAGRNTSSERDAVSSRIQSAISRKVPGEFVGLLWASSTTVNLDPRRIGIFRISTCEGMCRL